MKNADMSLIVSVLSVSRPKMGRLKVELAGIEPASKQGSLRLSTCLSYD